MNSDCLLAPSLCYENSPTVIYEAASCNLNFIFANLGGASELGKYLGGISFDSSDKNSLKTVIMDFIANRGAEFQENTKILGLNTDKYINNLLEFIEFTQKNS